MQHKIISKFIFKGQKLWTDVLRMMLYYYYTTCYRQVHVIFANFVVFVWVLMIHPLISSLFVVRVTGSCWPRRHQMRHSHKAWYPGATQRLSPAKCACLCTAGGNQSTWRQQTKTRERWQSNLELFCYKDTMQHISACGVVNTSCWSPSCHLYK